MIWGFCCCCLSFATGMVREKELASLCGPQPPARRLEERGKGLNICPEPGKAWGGGLGLDLGAQQNWRSPTYLGSLSPRAPERSQ